MEDCQRAVAIRRRGRRLVAMGVVLDPTKVFTEREPDQTRALYPDATGFIERDGVKVFYEVYGEGE